MKPDLALAGGMFAGKSTIADALTEYGYVRMSFAAALKNVAALAYGTVDKSEYYETTSLDGDLRDLSGRQILQGVGQAIKQVDRNFWIRCFLRDAKRYGGAPLIVDDMRFIFEMEALRAEGWFIVGIDTHMTTRLDRAKKITGRLPSSDELGHESEVEIPKVIEDADLIVDGTADPYENAVRILEAWKSSVTHP